MSSRTQLRLSIAAAVLLNSVIAIIWTNLISYLSAMAHARSLTCGTFYVSIQIQMQIFSLTSVLILLWASSSYRSNHAAMTQVARFLARLPLCVLLALNLAFWGTKPFMSGF